jgi:predicted  nucleic acid-binding Zn-ribbon protein
MKKGNLSRPVDERLLTIRDEIGVLANSFEDMRKDIRNTHKDLKNKSNVEIKTAKDQVRKHQEETRRLREEIHDKLILLKQFREGKIETEEEITSIKNRIDEHIRSIKAKKGSRGGRR